MLKRYVVKVDGKVVDHAETERKAWWEAHKLRYYYDKSWREWACDMVDEGVDPSLIKPWDLQIEVAEETLLSDEEYELEGLYD